MTSVEAIEDELYKSYVTIAAAEDWANEYALDPVSHAKLIHSEARLERDLRRFFREMSANANDFVDWGAYNAVLSAQNQVQADEDTLQVQVIVSDTAIAQTDGEFIRVVFEDFATAAGVGALAGQNIYNRPIGLTSTDATIQRFARNQAANLVGRRLDKDGNIVDAPNNKYAISNKTRQDIRESIRTSLTLGENQQTATERLRKTIKNPARAALIAQTEAVNAYQGGLLEFGRRSGAVGKKSRSIGAVDRCRTYALAGIVDLEYKYDGKYLCPAYHPRCRCGIRMVYQAELDANK